MQKINSICLLFKTFNKNYIQTHFDPKAHILLINEMQIIIDTTCLLTQYPLSMFSTKFYLASKLLIKSTRDCSQKHDLSAQRSNLVRFLIISTKTIRKSRFLKNKNIFTSMNNTLETIHAGLHDSFYTSLPDLNISLCLNSSCQLFKIFVFILRVTMKKKTHFYFQLRTMDVML